jgi:hypothetical protein
LAEDYTRKLFNVAKRTEHQGAYKEALTRYSKEIRNTRIYHGGGTARRSLMYQAVSDS